jgi:tRNA A37 threonylcarbamoyladenosine synthetase subunit TsaC/SUA5/YrdC
VLIDDACAAPDLEHRGVRVPADEVHAAFCAALGEEIATLVETSEFASEPARR